MLADEIREIAAFLLEDGYSDSNEACIVGAIQQQGWGGKVLAQLELAEKKIKAHEALSKALGRLLAVYRTGQYHRGGAAAEAVGKARDRLEDIDASS